MLLCLPFKRHFHSLIINSDFGEEANTPVVLLTPEVCSGTISKVVQLPAFDAGAVCLRPGSGTLLSDHQGLDFTWLDQQQRCEQNLPPRLSISKQDRLLQSKQPLWCRVPTQQILPCQALWRAPPLCHTIVLMQMELPEVEQPDTRSQPTTCQVLQVRG